MSRRAKAVCRDPVESCPLWCGLGRALPLVLEGLRPLGTFCHETITLLAATGFEFIRSVWCGLGMYQKALGKSSTSDSRQVKISGNILTVQL